MQKAVFLTFHRKYGIIKGVAKCYCSNPKLGKEGMKMLIAWGLYSLVKGMIEVLASVDWTPFLKIAVPCAATVIFCIYLASGEKRMAQGLFEGIWKVIKFLGKTIIGLPKIIIQTLLTIWGFMIATSGRLISTRGWSQRKARTVMIIAIIVAIII